MGDHLGADRPLPGPWVPAAPPALAGQAQSPLWGGVFSCRQQPRFSGTQLCSLLPSLQSRGARSTRPRVLGTGTSSSLSGSPGARAGGSVVWHQDRSTRRAHDRGDALRRGEGGEYGRDREEALTQRTQARAPPSVAAARRPLSSTENRFPLSLLSAANLAGRRLTNREIKAQSYA